MLILILNQLPPIQTLYLWIEPYLQWSGITVYQNAPQNWMVRPSSSCLRMTGTVNQLRLGPPYVLYSSVFKHLGTDTYRPGHL